MTDTKNAAERRKIRFENIDQVLLEIERIARADAAGNLRVMGNWTAGQILNHVAAWIEYGYDGYPMRSLPFFIRWFLRFSFKKTLREGMASGVKIPGTQHGTYGIDDSPTAVAAERLKSAFLRLQRGEPAKFDSPAFGAMSHEERTQLNLRHAELHLSFLDYPTT